VTGVLFELGVRWGGTTFLRIDHGLSVMGYLPRDQRCTRTCVQSQAATGECYMPTAGRFGPAPGVSQETSAQVGRTRPAAAIAKTKPRQPCCRISPDTANPASLVLPSRWSRPSITVPPGRSPT